MKKLILLIILSFTASSAKLLAQVCGGNPPWCTVGNNIMGTEYLGGDGTSTIPVDLKTLTDYAIRFYTNNATVSTPRMVILGGNATTGGYVGIGTTTPTAIIGINGNSARTIQMERNTTSNTAGNSLTVLSGGATIGATNKEGGLLLLSSGTSTGTGDSKIQLLTATGGATGTTDRTPTLKMIILGNGNVGIGTTIPCSLLDVKGTITATQIIIEKDNTKQDLLALIEQLQQRIAALEQQITASIKN